MIFSMFTKGYIRKPKGKPYLFYTAFCYKAPARAVVSAIRTDLWPASSFLQRHTVNYEA